MSYDYNRYHTLPQFKDIGSDTFQGRNMIKVIPNCGTVLDFGSGTGYAVKKMREMGVQAYGYDVSEVVMDKYNLDPDIFTCHVAHAFMSEIKYDTLYSTEVMEHIPEDKLGEVFNLFKICEFENVFMTISLRPSSSNNAFHCTLKPRDWWDERFSAIGFVPDMDKVKILQINRGRTTKKIMSQWRKFGPDCLSFCDNPPFELNGEEQPWYFIYRRKA